jgi:putative flippase GtrA
MRAFSRRALEYWPRHREKVMYLVVGGWNTLFTYGCFVVLYYLLNGVLASPVILVLVWAIATLNGYVTFRYLVFSPVRHPIVEYLRYQCVYLPILAANMVALPLVVTYTELSAYLVQAVISVFAVVAAYLGNKHFAFRKPTTKS